ncbi:MAG TPA: phosphocarrier protein HPr [Elusimicrobia bacterium]|jgi:phosphotransferase system HPr (HPr) family protein|nr:phosphocarrier protein HPr [Elusimicrobiota bacterium]
MQERNFLIKNKLGLHARPSALFVQTVNKFGGKVQVIKDNEQVDGKSIMGLLTLAAEYGSKIKVIVDGEKEEEDKFLDKIDELIKNKFGEE